MRAMGAVISSRSHPSRASILLRDGPSAELLLRLRCAIYGHLQGKSRNERANGYSMHATCRAIKRTNGDCITADLCQIISVERETASYCNDLQACGEPFSVAQLATTPRDGVFS